MKKIVIPIIAVILLLAGYKLFFPWTAARNPESAGTFFPWTAARNPESAGTNISCFGDSLTFGTGAVENMVSNIFVSR